MLTPVQSVSEKRLRLSHTSVDVEDNKVWGREVYMQPVIMQQELLRQGQVRVSHTPSIQLGTVSVAASITRQVSVCTGTRGSAQGGIRQRVPEVKKSRERALRALEPRVIGVSKTVSSADMRNNDGCY